MQLERLACTDKQRSHVDAEGAADPPLTRIRLAILSSLGLLQHLQAPRQDDLSHPGLALRTKRLAEGFAAGLIVEDHPGLHRALEGNKKAFTSNGVQQDTQHCLGREAQLDC